MRLDDLAREWLDWKNTSKPSPATLRARTADLAVIGTIIARQTGRKLDATADDPLSTALADLTESHLTRQAVTRAFAEYARDHAPSSIRRCRSTWSGFCSWLIVHRELIEANPLDFVEPPRAKRWRPKPIGEDDLVRVVMAAQTPADTARNPWPELERALCAVFVGAGVRVSEAISMRVGDLRRSPTEVAKLHVTGKGGTTRTVPTPPEAVEVIDRYLVSREQRVSPYRATDPLLVRLSGAPLTPKAVDHLVSGWYRRAGVAPPRGALAHALRHTYATLLVERSGSVPEVQKLLGHSDMATTQAYIDVAARGVEETAMSNPIRGTLSGR
jgi:site-specific recombinase XerD